MTTVFVDTSGWIALLSREDRLHDNAVGRYQDHASAGGRLLTNNYVVDETATRLRYGLGLDAAFGFRGMLVAADQAKRLRITGWTGT